MCHASRAGPQGDTQSRLHAGTRTSDNQVTLPRGCGVERSLAESGEGRGVRTKRGHGIDRPVARRLQITTGTLPYPSYVAKHSRRLINYLFLPGYGLSCFECNSHNDSRCALDIPPDALKKDCSEHLEGSKFTMCRKITQSIEFEVNGRKYTSIHAYNQTCNTPRSRDFFIRLVQEDGRTESHFDDSTVSCLPWWRRIVPRDGAECRSLDLELASWFLLVSRLLRKTWSRSPLISGRRAPSAAQPGPPPRTATQRRLEGRQPENTRACSRCCCLPLGGSTVHGAITRLETR